MSFPDVGAAAPDFTLPGIQLVDGEVVRSEYSLSAAAGSPLILAFYPGDESAVCTAQLCSYQTELAGFTSLGATVWGISKQGLDSHERFARKEGLNFPLLSDEQGKAVSAYGIGLAGIGLRRSVFVIDAAGVLRWKHVALVGARFQKPEVLQKAVAETLAA